MLLSPTEMERLTIYTAAELARKRRGRGLKLNHPEAVALVSDEILEGARDGRTVAELIRYGSQILTTDDVMPGVAELMPIIQVEGSFPDGVKLVTVHDPISPGEEAVEATDSPGELFVDDDELEINPGRERVTLTVVNQGDRPVQVGSHFHFFEVNRYLEFDRSGAFGMHLDIPAGTAARFEPGNEKEVTLVAFGGSGELYGLNSLTNGSRRSDETKQGALKRARDRGFKGA